MLRSRPGFTLAETIVALTLTAVIGAAVTAVFISQSQFFDKQEKVGFARAVSRGAMNIMFSEMRMLESDSGVVAATADSVTLRVPYAMGLVCDDVGSLTISRLPADSVMLAQAGYSGYAYRRQNGTYTYVATTTAPSSTVATECNSNSITVISADSGGAVLNLSPTSAAADVGAAVFLYQVITYKFGDSGLVPGRRGLFRRVHQVHAANAPEELVAPFNASARFRFYTNSDSSVLAPPADVNDIIGFELVLDGVSERPDSDGTHQSVPLRTSVFFKN